MLIASWTSKAFRYDLLAQVHRRVAAEHTRASMSARTSSSVGRCDRISTSRVDPLRRCRWLQTRKPRSAPRRRSATAGSEHRCDLSRGFPNDIEKVDMAGLSRTKSPSTSPSKLRRVCSASSACSSYSRRRDDSNYLPIPHRDYTKDGRPGSC